MFGCHIPRVYNGCGQRLHVHRDGWISGRPHMHRHHYYRPALVCPRPVIVEPTVPYRSWSCSKCCGSSAGIAAIITGLMLTVIGIAALSPPVAIIGAVVLIAGIAATASTEGHRCH